MVVNSREVNMKSVVKISLLLSLAAFVACSDDDDDSSSSNSHSNSGINSSVASASARSDDYYVYSEPLSYVTQEDENFVVVSDAKCDVELEEEKGSFTLEYEWDSETDVYQYWIANDSLYLVEGYESGGEYESDGYGEVYYGENDSLYGYWMDLFLSYNQGKVYQDDAADEEFFEDEEFTADSVYHFFYANEAYVDSEHDILWYALYLIWGFDSQVDEYEGSKLGTNYGKDEDDISGLSFANVGDNSVTAIYQGDTLEIDSLFPVASSAGTGFKFIVTSGKTTCDFAVYGAVITEKSSCNATGFDAALTSNEDEFTTCIQKLLASDTTSTDTLETDTLEVETDTLTVDTLDTDTLEVETDTTTTDSISTETDVADSTLNGGNVSTDPDVSYAKASVLTLSKARSVIAKFSAALKDSED